MKITTIADLDNAIFALENKRTIQEALLKEQVQIIKESLSPSNLIKDSLQKLSLNVGANEGLAKTIATVGLGLVSQRLLSTKSSKQTKSLLYSFIEQSLITGLEKNKPVLKAYARAIYRNLFRKKAIH